MFKLKFKKKKSKLTWNMVELMIFFNWKIIINFKKINVKQD